MQNERMQEHQRNMQDHNQNVPEYGRNMHQMQNNSSGNGSLSHGANLNKKNDSDAQSAPYMVNSYGEKQYIDPSVQTYSGTQKMTSAETEKLKQEIRSRNNFNGKNVTSHRAEAPVPQYVTPPPAADNAAPAMKTLDKAEFHSPVMQAGSTGTEITANASEYRKEFKNPRQIISFSNTLRYASNVQSLVLKLNPWLFKTVGSIKDASTT